jgi:flagellar basal-body rod protein FlgG
MLRPIDTSRAGMMRQQQQLDAVAHNIANNSTAGFKALRVALESGDTPPPGEQVRTADPGTPPLTGTVPVSRLFTQGSVEPSTSPTDLAIIGEGFFVVRQPNGTEGYTRNGNFHIDSSGGIVDAVGRRLEPPVTVPYGAADLRLEADGSITVQLPAGQRQGIGDVQVARFPNPNGLLAGADGVYTPTAASGPAQLSRPGENGAGTVRSGALERANTDLAEQMTNLLAAQRAYQLNTSAFRMADDMLRMAGQLGGQG